MSGVPRYDDRLEVCYAKWKLAGQLLSFALFAGLFLWAGLVGYPLALLGAVFFGSGFISTFPKLFDNEIQIIVDMKGIHDCRRQCWSQTVMIPWEDIQSIYLLPIGRFRQVHLTCIKFKNPENYFPKMAPIYRWTQKLDRTAHLGISGIGLTSNGLDVFNYILDVRSNLDIKDEIWYPHRYESRD